jgi:ABC-2 type transport system permease protein
MVISPEMICTKGVRWRLGFDRYTNTSYGNKSFLLNVMDYLCDDAGLMEIRTKEFRLRQIDPAVTESDTQPLRVLNVSLPILIILLFGLIKSYARRRRYAS